MLAGESATGSNTFFTKSGIINGAWGIDKDTIHGDRSGNIVSFQNIADPLSSRTVLIENGEVLVGYYDSETNMALAVKNKKIVVLQGQSRNHDRNNIFKDIQPVKFLTEKNSLVRNDFAGEWFVVYHYGKSDLILFDDGFFYFDNDYCSYEERPYRFFGRWDYDSTKEEIHIKIFAQRLISLEGMVMATKIKTHRYLILKEPQDIIIPSEAIRKIEDRLYLTLATRLFDDNEETQGNFRNMEFIHQLSNSQRSLYNEETRMETLKILEGLSF